MGTATGIKHPVPDQVKQQSIVRVPGCQKLQLTAA